MASASLQSIVSAAATSNGVPPAIAFAQAQQESSWTPGAYNAGSGATGLFQLEPPTAADLGVTNLTDPTQNANGAMTYMAQLYAKFGDWGTALAAYDWGMGNVEKAQAQYGSNWLSYAPAETQNYVSTILGNAGMDESTSVTPSSIANGVTEYVQNLLPDDSPIGTAVSANPMGTALLVGGGCVALFLLARELADVA
jgi:Transglycosylase SLT domain